MDSLVAAKINNFKRIKKNFHLPGDKFLPKKGLEVYMLRKTVVPADLVAPKSISD